MDGSSLCVNPFLFRRRLYEILDEGVMVFSRVSSLGVQMVAEFSSIKETYYFTGMDKASDKPVPAVATKEIKKSTNGDKQHSVLVSKVAPTNSAVAGSNIKTHIADAAAGNSVHPVSFSADVLGPSQPSEVVENLGNILNGKAVVDRGYSSHTNIPTAAEAVAKLQLTADEEEAEDLDIILELSSLLKSTKQSSGEVTKY
ncbi:hypothetical protein M9H77_18387 [Catharanthus roseus]|uniref:Uncharacterized protein n=1 Tax=Catharanthus roseus TaxID=4058 RepID=A0ACC0B7B3_CATRO|nr:hypothetical protein M9H77_18387 [Catharanthus roseus]